MLWLYKLICLFIHIYMYGKNTYCTYTHTVNCCKMLYKYIYIYRQAVSIFIVASGCLVVEGRSNGSAHVSLKILWSGLEELMLLMIYLCSSMDHKSWLRLCWLDIHFHNSCYWYPTTLPLTITLYPLFFFISFLVYFNTLKYTT